MATQSVERFQTVIVGGGQAGLATGYHLAKRGASFVILDAGERIGDPWRRRWDSLRLYSPARYDGLPGMRYPGRRASFPTTHEMADFLESYAARFELPVRTSTAVDTLTRNGERYVVTAGAKTFEADNVVVATGVMQKPVVPTFAPELDPSITQLHSSDYRNLSQLQEGRVLVVGASHSGADIAHEAAAEHETILSGRDTGQIPASVETRRGRARPARALLRRLTRADGRHAARSQDASAHQARRCATAAVPEEGSARRWSRARLCAYRRRAGRPAGARRRPRPRRSERRSGAPASVPTTRGSRSRSSRARTAIPSSTAAPSTRRPASTSWGCCSCTRSRRCSSRARAEMPSASQSTSWRGPRRNARRRPRRLPSRRSLRSGPPREGAAERSREGRRRRGGRRLDPRLERPGDADATSQRRGGECVSLDVESARQTPHDWTKSGSSGEVSETQPCR